MEFYPSYTGLDIKAEFESFLDGGYFESARGQKVILRRLTNTPCACFNAATGSPNSECSYCQGEGYQWYETWESIYIARLYGSVLGATTTVFTQNRIDKSGVIDDQRAVAYFRVCTWPDYEQKLSPTQSLYDKLYEVRIDDLGNPVYTNGLPIRTAKWRVQGVTLHQGDSGIPAYFECGITREAI